MQGNTNLGAELHGTYTSGNSSSRSELTAHINVTENGEWIGDFFATFTRQRLCGEDKYVADWDSLRTGNGIYVDEQPPFWPVEEVADELNEKFELRDFEAINSGPNDI